MTVYLQLRIMRIRMNSALFTSLQKVYIQWCPAGKTGEAGSSILAYVLPYFHVASQQYRVDQATSSCGLYFLLCKFRCLKIRSVRFLLALSFDIHMFIYSLMQWGLLCMITRNDVFNYKEKLVVQKPGPLLVSMRKRAFLRCILQKSC